MTQNNHKYHKSNNEKNYTTVNHHGLRYRLYGTNDH